MPLIKVLIPPLVVAIGAAGGCGDPEPAAPADPKAFDQAMRELDAEAMRQEGRPAPGR